MNTGKASVYTPCATCSKPVREGFIHTCPPRMMCKLAGKREPERAIYLYTPRDAAIAMVMLFEGVREKWPVATGRESIKVQVTDPQGLVTIWTVTGVPTYRADEVRDVR